jgi:TonB family protein
MATPDSAKKRRPEPPAPAARRAPGGTALPSLDLPSAGDASASGTATGLSFGAAVSNFDSDFPFAYYVEQLQSLIGANWLKPDVPPGTSCQVSFRILRSGQVTDVRVEVPSALAFYDRAATRALYAANPLPPLPPEFRGESLGVHIRFQ